MLPPTTANQFRLEPVTSREAAKKNGESFETIWKMNGLTCVAHGPTMTEYTTICEQVKVVDLTYLYAVPPPSEIHKQTGPSLDSPTLPPSPPRAPGLPQHQHAEPRKASARDHSQVTPLRLDATQAKAGRCSRGWRPSLQYSRRFRQQGHRFSSETHDPSPLGRGECTAVPDRAGQHMHVQRLGRVLVGPDDRGQQRFVNGSERDGRLSPLGAKIITRPQARYCRRGWPRRRAGDPTHRSSSAHPCTPDRHPLEAAGPGLSYHPHARGTCVFLRAFVCCCGWSLFARALYPTRSFIAPDRVCLLRLFVLKKRVRVFSPPPSALSLPPLACDPRSLPIAYTPSLITRSQAFRVRYGGAPSMICVQRLQGMCSIRATKLEQASCVFVFALCSPIASLHLPQMGFLHLPVSVPKSQDLLAQACKM